MTELTDSQIDFLQKKLIEQGISHEPLLEEMIDHLACLIEGKLQEGWSFYAAFENVWQLFSIDELDEIQTATISIKNKKSKSMKNLAYPLSVGVFALFFALSFVNWDVFFYENNLSEKFDQSLKPSDAIKPTFVNQLEPPSSSPLKNGSIITSPFGKRFHPIFKAIKMHRGVDFKAAIGTPVYATADGIVEKVITHNNYGKLIVLKHDDIYQTYYAQLSEFNVKTNQIIKKGDLIGKVGNSGKSTAPHLHYEVLKNGKRVDPEKYF